MQRILPLLMGTTTRDADTRRAVGTFFFLQGFIFATWGTRIPHVQQALGLGEAALGAVLAALPAGMLLSLPVAGWAVGRFGSRTVAAWASPAYAAILVVIGTARAPWQLAAVLFCFGVAGNFHTIAINTQAVGVEARYRRSIMAAFHGLWSLAGFLAASLGTYFIALRMSTLAHLAVGAAVAVALYSVAHRYLLAQDVGQDTQRPPFVWPDAPLRWLSAVAFCGMVCEGAMFDWSGVYFQTVVRPDARLVTLGYVAYMATASGGRFVGDWLANRLGVRLLLRINGILIACGLLLSVSFPHVVTATIGFLIVGAGTSTVVPMLYSLAGRSDTLAPGMAIAAVSSVGFLGFLLGPPLIGFLAEGIGLRWAFAGIAVLGSGIALLIERVPGRGLAFAGE
ncbi:MAG: MFS transporter [Catalinimonas sp.]